MKSDLSSYHFGGSTQVVFCPKKPIWLGANCGDGMMPSVRP